MVKSQNASNTKNTLSTKKWIKTQLQKMIQNTKINKMQNQLLSLAHQDNKWKNHKNKNKQTQTKKKTFSQKTLK